MHKRYYTTESINELIVVDRLSSCPLKHYDKEVVTAIIKCERCGQVKETNARYQLSNQQETEIKTLLKTLNGD